MTRVILRLVPWKGILWILCMSQILEFEAFLTKSFAQNDIPKSHNLRLVSNLQTKNLQKIILKTCFVPSSSCLDTLELRPFSLENPNVERGFFSQPNAGLIHWWLHLYDGGWYSGEYTSQGCQARRWHDGFCWWLLYPVIFWNRCSRSQGWSICVFLFRS